MQGAVGFGRWLTEQRCLETMFEGTQYVGLLCSELPLFIIIDYLECPLNICC